LTEPYPLNAPDLFAEEHFMNHEANEESKENSIFENRMYGFNLTEYAQIAWVYAQTGYLDIPQP